MLCMCLDGLCLIVLVLKALTASLEPHDSSAAGGQGNGLRKNAPAVAGKERHLRRYRRSREIPDLNRKA